jgi:hypothetical protein
MVPVMSTSQSCIAILRIERQQANEPTTQQYNYASRQQQ